MNTLPAHDVHESPAWNFRASILVRHYPSGLKNKPVRYSTVKLTQAKQCVKKNPACAIDGICALGCLLNGGKISMQFFV